MLLSAVYYHRGFGCPATPQAISVNSQDQVDETYQGLRETCRQLGIDPDDIITRCCDGTANRPRLPLFVELGVRVNMPIDTFEAANRELEPMRALIREIASLMHTIQINGGVSTREEDAQFTDIGGRFDTELERIVGLVPLLPDQASWLPDWLRLLRELAVTWTKLMGKISPDRATALEQAARTWGLPVAVNSGYAAADLPPLWWEIIRPPPCECGQTFERDVTEFSRHPQGGFQFKCPDPSCGRVKRLRLTFE